jgi:hypothetical protein
MGYGLAADFPKCNMWVWKGELANTSDSVFYKSSKTSDFRFQKKSVRCFGVKFSFWDFIYKYTMSVKNSKEGYLVTLVKQTKHVFLNLLRYKKTQLWIFRNLHIDSNRFENWINNLVVNHNDFTSSRRGKLKYINGNTREWCNSVLF